MVLDLHIDGSALHRKLELVPLCWKGVTKNKTIGTWSCPASWEEVMKEISVIGVPVT